MLSLRAACSHMDILNGNFAARNALRLGDGSGNFRLVERDSASTSLYGPMLTEISLTTSLLLTDLDSDGDLDGEQQRWQGQHSSLRLAGLQL